MVAEIEPNDTIATAQPLNLGFDEGEVTNITVNGTVTGTSAPPPPPPRSINATENNGSIGLATETGILAGTSDAVVESFVFISSSVTGSPVDAEFFRVSSLAGQTINATVTEITSFDPIIVVWDSAGNIVAFDVGTGNSSTLEFQAPFDGDFFITVHAFDAFISNPFDPAAITDVFNDSGSVRVEISQTALPQTETDFFSVELEAGGHSWRGP